MNVKRSSPSILTIPFSTNSVHYIFFKRVELVSSTFLFSRIIIRRLIDNNMANSLVVTYQRDTRQCYPISRQWFRNRYGIT